MQDVVIIFWVVITAYCRDSEQAVHSLQIAISKAECETQFVYPLSINRAAATIDMMPG